MAIFDDSVYNFAPDQSAPNTRLEAIAGEECRPSPLFESTLIGWSPFKRKSGSGDSMQIKEEGQVSSMTLSGDWKERKNESEGGGPYSHVFTAAKDKNVQLEFYYRGHRLGSDDARTFAEVLAKEPHYLDMNELNSLRTVLSGKGWVGDNTQLMAKTEIINGKTVLVVEQASKLKDQRSRTTFVDADSTRPGSVVQEIIFRAPNDKYADYVSKIARSMQTIRWK